MLVPVGDGLGDRPADLVPDRVRDFVDHVLPGDGFTHSRPKEPRPFLAAAYERGRALRDAAAGRTGTWPDARQDQSRPAAAGVLADD
jgi:hypothetical protein